MKVRIRMKDRSRSDGQHLLMFDFHIKGSRKRLSTEIFVYPESWDARHEEIIKSKRQFDAKGLNDLLQIKKSLLVNCYYTLKRKNKATLQNVVSKYLQESTDEENEYPSIEKFFDEYKERFAKIKSHNTLRKGDQVIAKLLLFNPKIDWEDLTETFWTEYCRFLIEDHNLSGSTIDRHGIEIKLRCQEALKLYQVPLNNDFERFEFKHYRVQPFWATWEEIEGIEKALTLSKTEEHVRDNFIFTANTGLRNSDSHIRKANLFYEKRKPFLRVVIKKTGFDYNIPLNKKALDILTKYDFSLPEHAQATYNSYIKNIASRVPLCREPYEEISYVGRIRQSKTVKRFTKFSTHTARRTFGRRWLDRGGSLVILSQYFGHADPKQTLIYIGYTAEELTNEFMRVFH
ncbi:MAG: tyrosine-type recombinase/integrase [Bacteroidota bacterium]|nr:tyrosine-type recombinase/integrase [Bacteroidota bacterium]